MGLFGKSKPSSYLGVDIGVGGIKLVELANEKGRSRLLTYAYSERALHQQGTSLLEDPAAAAELLVKMVKQSGATTTKVISGLPQQGIFQSILNIPKVKNPQEMKVVVDAQVSKLTPIPITDMIIDSRTVGENKDDGRVLVTGAPKAMVQKYIDIFKRAKLDLVALETESLAMIRSLVGRDRSIIMILDVGAMRTNITVVEKGVPVLARSVNVGGGRLTQQIADQMGLSLEEAEQMKLDLSKGTMEGVPPAVQAIVQPMLTEINYSMGEFARQDGHDEQTRIEKLILTGGSAQLPGIVPYLSGQLKMNVYVGDPWARVAVPEALRPVLDDIGPRFAVSVGLGMRDIE